MQTEEQLRLVVSDMFQQLKADNVIYAEIRFAPLLHLQNGLRAEQVVQAVLESTGAASRETGIEAGIIVCTLRHFTVEQSLETAQLAQKFRNEGVVAIDIAGDEAGFPLAPHRAAFEYAVRQAIPRTCHAGEASGAESVWETLRLLEPSRIGHGVRSIEDPALVEHLKQHKIHLEVCPTSNIQTDIYASYSEHPVQRLYDSGIELGINTDARTITNITLTQEYEKLERHFGWAKKELLNCNLNAVRAAFAPDKTKQRIVDKLTKAYHGN
jgi:adenosine deaminase